MFLSDSSFTGLSDFPFSLSSSLVPAAANWNLRSRVRLGQARRGRGRRTFPLQAQFLSKLPEHPSHPFRARLFALRHLFVHFLGNFFGRLIDFVFDRVRGFLHRSAAAHGRRLLHVFCHLNNIFFFFFFSLLRRRLRRLPPGRKTQRDTKVFYGDIKRDSKIRPEQQKKRYPKGGGEHKGSTTTLSKGLLLPKKESPPKDHTTKRQGS